MIGEIIERSLELKYIGVSAMDKNDVELSNAQINHLGNNLKSKQLKSFLS